MSITVEYRGEEFEFDTIPSEDELEERYRERTRSKTRDDGSTGGGADVVQPAEYDRVAPLPSGGQRMWTLQQTDRGGAAFNLVVLLQIEGDVDRTVVRRTFETLVERHEVLRTTFPIRDGVPVQQIEEPDHELDWTYRDVQEADAPRERAKSLVDEAFHRPFELTEETPIRILLIRESEESLLLAFVFHHISMDKIGAGSLIGEFARVFGSYREGRPPQLGEVSLQYGDYAVWQRERLESAAFDEGIEFWRDYLDGASDAIDWPEGEPPEAGTGATGLVSFEWSEETSGRLRERAESLGIRSEYLFLGALYEGFLARYAGQWDLTIGLEMAVAARRRPELLRTVGYMFNVIPMRAELDPAASLEDWLTEARSRWGELFQYQWIPLDAIVDAVDARRYSGRRPLFETVFTYTPAEVDLTKKFEGHGIEVLEYGVHPPGARAALELEMWGDGAAFTGHFIYDQSRFDRESVARLAEEFEGFVEQFSRHPERPLENYEVAGGSPDAGGSGDERRQTERALGGEREEGEHDARIEAKLVELWTDILELESVEREIDFFRAGGDSLEAVLLRDRLEKEFSIELEVADLVEHASIRDQVSLVDSLRATRC